MTSYCLNATLYQIRLVLNISSESKFSTPTELMSNHYPPSDIYRKYIHAGSGFSSTKSIRDDAEARIAKFAENQNKSYVILGEQTTKPPFVLGHYPEIEIIFALINKGQSNQAAVKDDKLDRLAKLKKLLDDGKKEGIGSALKN